MRGLSHNDVRAICEDAKGDLWVGTSYGLNRMRVGQFENFITPTPELALETIYTLYADEAGSLWIGTAERRVAYYPYLPPGEYQFKVIACNNDAGGVHRMLF